MDYRDRILEDLMDHLTKMKCQFRAYRDHIRYPGKKYWCTIYIHRLTKVDEEIKRINKNLE